MSVLDAAASDGSDDSIVKDVEMIGLESWWVVAELVNWGEWLSWPSVVGCDFTPYEVCCAAVFVYRVMSVVEVGDSDDSVFGLYS